MYNLRGDAMKKVIGVLVLLLIPMRLFGADLIKLKQVTSVYADAAGVGIRQPEGVDCNEQSGFVVADTGNGRLIHYQFLEGTVMAGKEIKIPELTYPLVVKTNSKGDMFALDGIKRRILHIGSDGLFKGYVDPTGMPAPAVVVPRSFTIDHDDNLLVLDILSDRVLLLDAEGKYLRQLEFPQNFGFISDIAVDKKGTIFLIDSVEAEVFAASKEAAAFIPFTKDLREYVDFPTAITTDLEGRLFITDRNGSGIVIIGPNGSFQGRQLSLGRSEGYLNYPSELCINEKGFVFIADRNNSRIQIFTILK